MRSFATRIAIAAPADTVWALLTDAPGYPVWNPTVQSIDGTIAPDQKITVHATINPGKAFPVRVAEFVPGKRMVWRGGMPFGLFVGERTYTLDEQSGGVVAFAMREEYRGMMAGLITKSIPDLQPAFDEFAAALKARAEAG